MKKQTTIKPVKAPSKPKTGAKTTKAAMPKKTITSSKKQPVKTIKPQGKILPSKKSQAKAGEFWTVNNKEIRGHKTEILKRRKNGALDVAMITHSKKHGNIKLQENPQPNDKREAYVVRQKKRTTVQKLGKKHPDMKIKNKTDKAVIRKIKKQK